MIVEVRAGGPFQENGYVIGCENTREAVIVDPGDSVAELLEYAARANLSIRHILLTHAHVDHITGVAAASRATGAPVHLHRGDTFLYDDAAAIGAMFGMRVEAPPPVDEFYSAGTAIPFGNLEARPHHTPGHSPGGVCLEIGAAGRGSRDLFVGDYATLIASIRDVLFPFGDEARVHSGHGPATTIGRERRTNAFLVDAV